jgi:hypothetical protein
MATQICALVGPDLMMGVSGFGDSVHEALAENRGDRMVDLPD